MALGNYTDLKTAVATWLHRDDLALSIPDFVSLAEARLNRLLRMRQQLTTGTLTTTANTATVDLPAGWLQFHRLRLASPDQAIDFLPGAQFEVKYRASDVGAPKHHTIEGENLVLGPKPDSVYSIEAVYYGAIPTLTDAASSNWVLTAWPGLYLFAALAEAAPFLNNDVRVATWESKFAADLQQAQDADRRARASGSGLRMRPR